MSDFFNTDFFNPPSPQVKTPEVSKSPLSIPEEDRLYQVQRNALKALNRVREIRRLVMVTKTSSKPTGQEREVTSRNDQRLEAELMALEADIENTYRVIRSWLVKHT